MNGLWKENLGGWNNKDSKRKRQSRKHTLKDKVKPLIKTFYYKDIDNYSLYNEANKFEVINSKIIKKSGFIEIWNIHVEKYVGRVVDGPYLRGIWSSSYKKAYNINGEWFDSYSNRKITNIKNTTIKKTSFISLKEIEYDVPIEIKDRNHSSPFFKDEIFIYGKPLCQNWHDRFGFWSTKRRKIGQNLANKTDRHFTRKYISEKNWDKEIGTHHLSKSISWYVH